MKLKINADGSAAVRDGKPLYMAASGREVAFDYEASVAATDALKREIGAYRKVAAGTLDLLVGALCERSQFVADRIAIPADILAARFRSAFKIEGGKLIATDANGREIYSRIRPGELAEFDEALEVLVDRYPEKAAILKATGPSQGHQPSRVDKPTMTRAQFDALPPTARMDAIRNVQLVDA